MAAELQYDGLEPLGFPLKPKGEVAMGHNR